MKKILIVAAMAATLAGCTTAAEHNKNAVRNARPATASEKAGVVVLRLIGACGLQDR